LLVEILKLRLHRGLALEGGAGEVLTAGAERLARLRVELDDALLELRRLELEALLRGDHVGDPALDVLVQLELFLVRVFERRARSPVLGLVAGDDEAGVGLTAAVAVPHLGVDLGLAGRQRAALRVWRAEAEVGAAPGRQMRRQRLPSASAPTAARDAPGARA